MLTEERHAGILEVVNRQGSATLSELCGLLNISESTARRDLSFLNEKGLLVKVRGGAVAVKDTFAVMERDVAEKEKLFADEKKAIAEYAASLIEDGDFVFIDAGTTTEKIIDYLPDKDAVFVTNAFVHAKKLAKRGFRVFIPAGEIKAKTEAVVGAACVISLREYNFTKCFLGINGISLTSGFTTPDKSEADVKKAVLSNSQEVYFLADHSKFDNVTAVTVTDITKGKVITDRLQSKKYLGKASIKEVL